MIKNRLKSKWDKLFTTIVFSGKYIVVVLLVSALILNDRLKNFEIIPGMK